MNILHIGLAVLFAAWFLTPDDNHWLKPMAIGFYVFCGGYRVGHDRALRDYVNDQSEPQSVFGAAMFRVGKHFGKLYLKARRSSIAASFQEYAKKIRGSNIAVGFLQYTNNQYEPQSVFGAAMFRVGEHFGKLYLKARGSNVAVSFQEYAKKIN